MTDREEQQGGREYQIIVGRAGHVRQTYQWYDELWRANDGNPPLITRDILDKYYYHLSALSDVCFKTSGTSTGHRRTIWWSNEELQRNDNAKKKLFKSHIGANTRVAIDAGLGLAVNSAGRVFREIGCVVEAIDYTLPLDDHIEALMAFEAQTLYSMPSVVSQISKHPKLEDVGIKKLVLVGEVVSPSWVNTAASKFKIQPSDILDTYGCLEVGLIATRCGICGKFHVNQDIVAEVYIEPEISRGIGLRGATSAVPDGILVVTSRYRETAPVVRFVTYDVVHGFKNVECEGEPRVSFDYISGRLGTELKHGERLSFYDIENSMLSIWPTVDFQVLVSKNGLIRIEIRNEGDPGMPSANAFRESIYDRLPEIAAMAKGGTIPHLDVTYVNSLPERKGIGKKEIIYL